MATWSPELTPKPAASQSHVEVGSLIVTPCPVVTFWQTTDCGVMSTIKPPTARSSCSVVKAWISDTLYSRSPLVAVSRSASVLIGEDKVNVLFINPKQHTAGMSQTVTQWFEASRYSRR